MLCFFLEADKFTGELIQKLIMYPIVFAAIGLISCVCGILYLIVKKVSDRPHHELNITTWVSAGLTIVLNAVFTYLYFSGQPSDALLNAGFKIGVFSPWLASILGIVSGIAIGVVAEWYTSYDYYHTQRLARASGKGPAITITSGMALGKNRLLFRY